jgi:iron complex outermembrane receptor protein
MRSIEYQLAIAILLAGLPTQNAKAAAYPSEQDYLQEFPVVLSASRLSQPQSEAPNAVTVIDREMIKASGFRTIADLFRLVPGMYVGYENGHFPIVAYHGSIEQYSHRMQVLVDGRSVYLPPFSSVNWEDIPLHIADIERIEVVRGPAAASYGANSLQGVINFITRDASSANGASVAVAKGNGGIADVSAHLGKTGATLDYRVTLAYRTDNGFDTNILNDGNVTRLANLRANYHPSMSDSFDFQLGYNEGVRGEGGQMPSVTFGDTRSHSNFQQISWVRALPQFDEFKLNYYHISRNSKDKSFMPPIVDINIYRDELELQHTMHTGASNRLVWGGGVRVDSAEAKSAGVFNMTQSLKQSRLFAHDEWRMTESALLNAGAMIENDGMGHRNSSPRVALNYHLTPHHTLRAGASVAYRSPAMMEEVADIPPTYLSRGGLRPEKTFSREIGYLGELNSIGVTVDAKAYYDRVSDFIYYDPDPSTFMFSFGNLLSTTYRGFEGTIKYRWGAKNDLVFNYSRQLANCSVTGTALSPGPPFNWSAQLQNVAATCSSMVPQNSGSILLTQQARDDIQLSAGYYHQGKLQFLETPAPLTMMRSLDLRAAKTFGKPHESGGGEVALVVQNALRDSYTEYAAVPLTSGQIIFNRRAFITATMGF